MIPRALALTALLLVALALTTTAYPTRASASVSGAACKVAGAAGGAVGKACAVVSASGNALSAGKKLLGGHIGSAIKTFLGAGSGSASTASTAVGLAAMVTWVVAGAQFSISETTKVLGQTTRPQLATTWFSSAYWRIAGIAALLTLPFLFAAAVQALLRADLALLTRAAFGYLPLAMLAVGIAAPVTMLVLAATDQLCGVVSSAAGAAGPHFDVAHLGAIAVGAAPFLRFLVGVLTTAAAIVLWLELAVREAAVYVIVLMLPLAFAALVWPSRRVWAVRSVELLAALILSKLAIVAVLELGGAALDQLGHHGLGGIMAGLSGTALLLVAGLSPWAVLRLVPMAELASGAVESLRASAAGNYQKADAERRGAEHKLVELAAGITARMRAEAQHTGLASPRADGGAAEIRRTREADAAEHNGARGRSRAAIEHLPDTGDGGEGERDGSSGSDGGERGGGVPEHVEERLPRLDPMFQAPNGSWRPLTLGPDGEWPHPQLWPPDAADGPPVQESHSRLEPLPPGDDHEPTPPAEDHDPLPAPQEKPEGPL